MNYLEAVDPIDEIKRNASSLRKQGLFDAAIAQYEILFGEHRESCNHWDEWGYAYSLRKKGRFEEALGIIDPCFEKNPEFDQARNLYAWCLYDLNIKDFKGEPAGVAHFLEAAEQIAYISIEGDQYSPLVRTVMKVLDYFKSKQNYPAEEVISWLDKLDPKNLAITTLKYTDQRGKQRETASDKEKWYAHRTKALLSLGHYQNCIEACEEALSELDRYHFNNDIWLKWRKAVSKGHLGRRDEAIAELIAISKQKNEWFVQSEIARLYYESGKPEEALRYGIDAACNQGEPEKKWKLFLLIGRILYEKGIVEEGKKHVLLARELRNRSGWKDSEEIEEAIKEFRVEEEKGMTASVLMNDLEKYWHDAKGAYCPRSKGTIKNILPNNKAGFIEGEDGKDYYFRVSSFRGPRDRIEIGTRVSFSIEQSYDKKKERESEQATKIEEIDG